MTKNIEQDVAFIRALAELMRETDLGEIEVEREYGEDDEIKVRLSRAAPQAVAVQAAPLQQVLVPAAPAVPVAAPAVSAGPDLSNAVTSPMVGTAYLTPDPTSGPFVQVGETVSEGQTLLIIEAMKTMNQIPSPRAGVVRQILIGNAEPVEYGAPLMIIV